MHKGQRQAFQLGHFRPAAEKQIVKSLTGSTITVSEQATFNKVFDEMFAPQPKRGIRSKPTGSEISLAKTKNVPKNEKRVLSAVTLEDALYAEQEDLAYL
jgi:hypothetical protein